ncbi:MAG: hypothetical protein K2X81_16940 [Candidatus Obscuribacterales bacterium]|nr:hypothetical protein [Candidatus Obscuribacterales bacterium]
MSMQDRVEALKQQLEHLFPGKWLSNGNRQRNISTSVEAIDSGITRGIARKRITEWSGPLSSGKTTLLRNAVAHWCAQGLNVAYIDCEGKLYPADWASVETHNSGKFWIVRPEEKIANSDSTVLPLISKKNMLVQESIWSADQFIRSNAFDVVILDLGNNNLSGKKNLGMGYSSVPSRIYARLQRALDKSKAALIIASDSGLSPSLESSKDAEAGKVKNPAAVGASNNWGCHARFIFNRGMAIRCEAGLNGIAMIVPTIRLSAWRDGLSQEVEVNLGSSVPNRLFTHPQIPDRRTSKG